MTVSTPAGAVAEAKDHVENVVREASPLVRALARLGFVAKGVVYIIVGALALGAPFSRGGSTTDERGALRTILHQPFGRTMLVVAGVGLAGYCVWRMIQAFFDPEHVRHDAKGFGRRAARFVSGVTYGALAFTAWQMVFRGEQGGSGRTQDWTATLMSKPAGPWLVGIAGVVIIGVGGWQLYRAWTSKLGDKLMLDRWGARMRDWIITFGRVGYAARGVIFCMMGGFLLVAADRNNPQEAKGAAEAMRHVEGLSYGAWLLAAIAAGLIAYGLFQLVEARYRRIDVS